MALLRRRRRKSEDPAAPRRVDSAILNTPGLEEPGAWLPPDARPAPRSASSDAQWTPPEGTRPSQTANPSPFAPPGAWVPEGVELAPRPSRPGWRRPAELDELPAADDLQQPAAAEQAATEQPPAAAQPAQDPELQQRIAALEQQIAAAQQRAAALEARRDEPGAGTAAEAAAVAESYTQLQAALVDLRGRMDRETGHQRSTIDTLQTRLAGFEEELRRKPPGYVSPAARTATAVRVLAMIALFVVIAGAPLVMSRREKCHPGGRPQTHWRLVKPFDDNGPSHCVSELGGTVLLNSVGLK